MNNFKVTLCAIATIISSCHAFANDPVAFQPASFYAAIGGAFGTTYRITMTNDTLQYEAVTRGDHLQVIVLDRVVIKPSVGDWATFKMVVDELGVWQWEHYYDDPETDDGTRWHLRIAWGDKHIDANGDNAYPSDEDARLSTGSSLHSEIFQKLLKAISKLAQDKPFK